MNNECLNCGGKTEKKYCSNCGQSTSTHRFSLQHFFLHDFVHGIFHFDKGFIFTIKELFSRPGHSIREYIQGKRVNHFNCFTTIVLILTIEYFFTKFFHVNYGRFNESLSGFFKLQKDYFKIIPFLGIPFFALLSYTIFRKSKQNYTENLVLNTYLVCGWLIINFLNKVVFAITSNVDVITYTFNILIFIYVFIFYYQYFSTFKFRVPLFLKVFIITLLILLIKQVINNILNDIGSQFFH